MVYPLDPARPGLLPRTMPFTSVPGRPQPDWGRIHAELRKPGVTMLRKAA